MLACYISFLFAELIKTVHVFFVPNITCILWLINYLHFITFIFLIIRVHSPYANAFIFIHS